MRKLLLVVVCAAVVALTAGAIPADLPAPTEEEIETRLKEARNRTEAARAEERALQKCLDAARGQIRAEVEGVLCWNEKDLDYVRVRPKDDPKREIRVLLKLDEDKITGREFPDLRGKDVVVKGVLLRQATGELYMDRFVVERPAKVK